MKKKLFLILIISLFVNFSFGQNTIDSLKQILQEENIDTSKINLLIKIGNEYNSDDSVIFYYNKALSFSKEIKNQKFELNVLMYIANFHKETNNNETAIEFYEKANLLGEKIDNKKKRDKKNISSANLSIGFIYEKQGEYEKALKYYTKSLDISRELADTNKIAQGLNNFGLIYKRLGNYDKALEYYQESLLLCEKANIKRGTSFCLNNIGLIHKKQKNLDKALEYFEKSLEINISLKDTNSIGGANISIGKVYKEQKKYKKALKHFTKALNLFEKVNTERGMLYCYVNIADIYKKMNNFNLALQYYEKSTPFIEKFNDKKAKVENLKGLAEVYCGLSDSTQNLSQKNANYKLALEYALESLSLAESMNALPDMNDAYRIISKIYSGLNNFELAYQYSQKFISTKDSLFNTEKTKAIEEMEAIYQTEKKEQEIEKQDLLIEKKDAEAKKRNIQLIAFIIGFLLMIVLAIISFRNYQRKKKDNILIQSKNTELEQANEEIIAQRDMLQEQKEKIEVIHQQITDSIKYAKRIQQAAMPTEVSLNTLLGDSFVLFKPLHVVSGDFFWAKKVNKYIVFTAADCTGHGVPGAFVSMLGISLLNEIVQRNDITKANEVLEALRNQIKISLKQSSDFGDSKDGMDMALCVVNTETNELDFAGANNPLILIRNNELTEYKATRNPVAIYVKEKQFESTIIKLEDNDVIYLFSDGYADQPGGEKDRKFMKKRLKQTLLDIHKEKMLNQKRILTDTLEDWKGSTRQIDDILVIGVKFHI